VTVSLVFSLNNYLHQDDGTYTTRKAGSLIVILSSSFVKKSLCCPVEGMQNVLAGHNVYHSKWPEAIFHEGKEIRRPNLLFPKSKGALKEAGPASVCT
jgi:hypothetical protein